MSSIVVFCAQLNHFSSSSFQTEEMFCSNLMDIFNILMTVVNKQKNHSTVQLQKENSRNMTLTTVVGTLV